MKTHTEKKAKTYEQIFIKGKLNEITKSKKKNEIVLFEVYIEGFKQGVYTTK